jgi:hypothetical protein
MRETYRVVYLRHAGRFFFVFLVGAVRLNLEHLRFFPTHVGLIFFCHADLASGCICAVQSVLLKVLLFRRCSICHNHMGCCTHTA